MPTRTPTLVLLPGLDGTGELFDRFIQRLGSGIETIVVRYPATAGSYTDAEQIVRSALPNQGAYILLAESFSSPLAIHIARENPVGLVGLILSSGFAASPVKGLRRLISSWFAPFLFRMTVPSFAIRQFLVGEDPPTQLVSSVRTAIRSVKPGIIASRVRAVLQCDVRADLASLTVPILYLSAKQDRLIGTEGIAEIQRIAPAVRVDAIAGPHLLLQARPCETAAAVSHFMEKVGFRGVASPSRLPFPPQRPRPTPTEN